VDLELAFAIKIFIHLNKNIAMGTISGSRGDKFEIYINDTLNLLGWHSRRCGGTIINFPDIVATNNKDNIILAIEAKATSFDFYYVPVEQILRCFRTLEMFAVYENKIAILAFKFMTKRRMIERVDNRVFETDDAVTIFPKHSKYRNRMTVQRRYYEKRDIRYYYFIANQLMTTLLHPKIEYLRLVCYYEGKLKLIAKDRTQDKEIHLPRVMLNKNEIDFYDYCPQKNHRQNSSKTQSEHHTSIIPFSQKTRISTY
jgi:Holliday junction resolvase